MINVNNNLTTPSLKKAISLARRMVWRFNKDYIIYYSPDIKLYFITAHIHKHIYKHLIKIAMVKYYNATNKYLNTTNKYFNINIHGIATGVIIY